MRASIWHPAGAHVSHFFNALSVRRPVGERAFIESVRHYAGELSDPALAASVQCFVAQEAVHGREHDALNAALSEMATMSSVWSWGWCR